MQKITAIQEIRERAEYCFSHLFKMEKNDEYSLAEAMHGISGYTGMYIKPEFTDLKTSKDFINDILEHFSENDARTRAGLDNKLVKSWSKTNKKFLDWIKTKTTKSDLPLYDLFNDSNAENLFFECGIQHGIFSKNRKFINKKGFAYGMMQAFVKSNHIKIKSSRTAIQIFFKDFLVDNYSDPRSKRNNKESTFFRKGYDAAIKCIEASYE